MRRLCREGTLAPEILTCRRSSFTDTSLQAEWAHRAASQLMGAAGSGPCSSWALQQAPGLATVLIASSPFL